VWDGSHHVSLRESCLSVISFSWNNPVGLQSSAGWQEPPLACHVNCQWLALSTIGKFQKPLIFDSVLCSSLSSSFIMHLLIWLYSFIWLMFWGRLSKLNQSNSCDQTGSLMTLCSTLMESPWAGLTTPIHFPFLSSDYWTLHNPLVFLQQSCTTNQRLMRWSFFPVKSSTNSSH